MVALILSESQLGELIQAQVRKYGDWPARFSCNRREIWPTPSLGYSRSEDRHDLAGEFEILDRARELVLQERRNGGRVFICEHGVFTYLEDMGRKVQLAEFVLTSAGSLRMRCPEHH